MDQDLRSRIKAAAQERGVDPEIAVSFAKAESSLNPNAKAKTSSASGLFQVINQTWKEYGGGDKKDIDEQIRVGTDVIASNQQSFKRKFNREPSAAELYAYHVLGPTGAPQLLRADPNTPMEQVVSREAFRANPVWKGKTAGQVLGIYEKKVGGSQTPQASTQQPKPGMRPTNYSFEPLTQLDIDQMGPNYKAALAAVTLADTSDDDSGEGTERTMERMAENDSMVEEEAPMSTAAIRDIGVGQTQPVLMAKGGDVDGSKEGEAKGMLRRMYEGAVPAQARTFLETVVMSPEERTKRPITEKDFTEEEQRQMLESVINARKKRAQTLGLTEPVDPEIRKQKDDEFIKSFGVLKGQGKKDIENIVKNANESRRKEEEYFLSGKGNVHYYDYPNAHSMGDTTIGKDAAVRNTLGRFLYETTPEGKIKIKDRYDFKDDLAGVDGQRPSADYEKMSAAEKLKTLFMDTVDNPRDRLQKENRSIFTVKQGLDTLPSRVGSAFIGNQGRQVDITVDPRQLMPGVAGYAYGGPVYRADGSPEYGEISMGDFSGTVKTGDARKELSNFFKQGWKMPTKEDAKVLAQIPVEGVSNLESLARGSVAALPGMVGDVESAFRENQKNRKFATTEEILKRIPRVTKANKNSEGFEELGTYDIGLPGAAAAKLVSKVPGALKVAAPIAAEMALKAAPAAQPMNIVTPSGRVFLANKSYKEEPISNLDKALKSAIEWNNLVDNPEARPAIEFMDKKVREYFKNRAGTVGDEVREALITGRIKIPKNSKLEEQFPQALIDAARKGDVTSMRVLEDALHKETHLKSKTTTKDFTTLATDAPRANEDNRLAILEQMKSNPNMIPDEMLLRLIGKDVATMPTKEAAAKVAEIRAKLAQNPTLFNTIFESKIGRLIPEDAVEVITTDNLKNYGNLYPALTNAANKQEGIMALSQNAPITDIGNTMATPIKIMGLTMRQLIAEAQAIPAKELERMSVPDVINRAIQSREKGNEALQFANKAERLVDQGKPIPENISLFGTKEFLPKDKQGFVWREIVDPHAAAIQSVLMKNSIKGYSERGTYGFLGKGMMGMERGEVRLFSLYDPKGQAVTNVEYITPTATGKVIDDGSVKRNSITQFFGNGPRTGNVAPTDYLPQVENLVRELNPDKIPATIKELFRANNISFTK